MGTNLQRGKKQITLKESGLCLNGDIFLLDLEFYAISGHTLCGIRSSRDNSSLWSFLGTNTLLCSRDLFPYSRLILEELEQLIIKEIHINVWFLKSIDLKLFFKRGVQSNLKCLCVMIWQI